VGHPHRLQREDVGPVGHPTGREQVPLAVPGKQRHRRPGQLDEGDGRRGRPEGGVHPVLLAASQRPQGLRHSGATDDAEHGTMRGRHGAISFRGAGAQRPGRLDEGPCTHQGAGR
jgi:hypothetical protein